MNTDAVCKFVTICLPAEEFILYTVIENRKLHISLNCSCVWKIYVIIFCQWNMSWNTHVFHWSVVNGLGIFVLKIILHLFYTIYNALITLKRISILNPFRVFHYFKGQFILKILNRILTFNLRREPIWFFHPNIF